MYNLFVITLYTQKISKSTIYYLNIGKKIILLIIFFNYCTICSTISVQEWKVLHWIIVSPAIRSCAHCSENKSPNFKRTLVQEKYIPDFNWVRSDLLLVLWFSLNTCTLPSRIFSWKCCMFGDNLPRYVSKNVAAGTRFSRFSSRLIF